MFSYFCVYCKTSNFRFLKQFNFKRHSQNWNISRCRENDINRLFSETAHKMKEMIWFIYN